MEKVTDEQYSANKAASPMPTNKSSIELGTENQTRLAGRPVTPARFMRSFPPSINS